MAQQLLDDNGFTGVPDDNGLTYILDDNGNWLGTPTTPEPPRDDRVVGVVHTQW